LPIFSPRVFLAELVIINSSQKTAAFPAKFSTEEMYVTQDIVLSFYLLANIWKQHTSKLSTIILDILLLIVYNVCALSSTLWMFFLLLNDSGY
jgi:hypothetical protein